MELGKGVAWLAFLGIVSIFSPSDKRQVMPHVESGPAFLWTKDSLQIAPHQVSCTLATVEAQARGEPVALAQSR